MTKPIIKNQPLSMLSINVETLKQGPILIDQSIPLDWLSKEIDICEFPLVPLRSRVNLTVEALDAGILVRGFVEAEVKVECGTCLAELRLDLNATISNYMSPMADYINLGEEEELTPEELEKEYYTGDVIVLDSLIRDSIIIELPMNPKCSETCSEFVSSFVKEEKPTIDPRLAPLANIKISKEK